MAYVKKGRPGAGEVGLRDDYRLVNRSKKNPDGILQCQLCATTTAIKSNQGIQAELSRLSAYLAPSPEPACPSTSCSSAKMGVFSYPEAYTCKGKLKSSVRMKCKTCGELFTVSTSPTHRQRKPHLNKTVFQELVTKKPICGTAKVTEMSPKAVYDKIDFIYEQCLGFLGEREARAHRINR
jgi:transposase-like protein